MVAMRPAAFWLQTFLSHLSFIKAGSHPKRHPCSSVTCCSQTSRNNSYIYLLCLGFPSFLPLVQVKHEQSFALRLCLELLGFIRIHKMNVPQRCLCCHSTADVCTCSVSSTPPQSMAGDQTVLKHLNSACD